MNGFAVYYIESNLVCMIVFGILLIHNHFNIDKQEKQIKFDHAMIAFMLYFLADSFWAAIVSEMIPKTRFSVVVDVFLIYIFMSAVTYYWLEYVMAYEQVPHRNRPINRFAVLFPFLVSTAALVVNYCVAPRMLVDDALNSTAAFSIYLVTVPCIYLVAVLFYAMQKAKAEENPSERRRHLFVALFPLLTLICGLIQTGYFPYIPIYCFSVMILMLMFYIQDIEQRISLDPLTQLNNRGQLKRYAAQPSNLHMEGRLTLVAMMDIDGFKAINDTYGHAEGDKALVVVADSLKRAMNSHNMPCFLGRYGGDEFILILHPIAKDEADRLIQQVRDEIARTTGEKPYRLSVSAGYAELLGVDSIQSCIQQADEKLYQDKAHRKRVK